MAINNNTKFGVVYTTPADFVSKIGAKDASYTNGKLFVLNGESSGAITQGIYMVEPDNSTQDGSLNITMLSSGAYVGTNNAGLMSSAMLSDLNALKNASTGWLTKADASTTYLKIADASYFSTIKVGNTSIAADSSKDTLTFVAGNNVTLTPNDTDDSITIAATDTNTWREVKVNGTSKINTSTNTALDISAGDNIDVSWINNKIVISGKDIDASHATNADNASTAEVASTLAHTFYVAIDNSNKISFNGSTNKQLNFIDSSTIKVKYDASGAFSFDTSGIPTKTEMDTAISTALTSALKYKGTVNDSNYTTKLNISNAETGDVYVANGKFNTTTSYTTQAYSIEVGDYFIFNGTKFDVVGGENQVDNKTADISANGTARTLTLATVDGTDITIKVPAAYYTHPTLNTNASTAVSTSDGGDFAFSSSNKTLQVITGAQSDASGHISKLIYKDIALPTEAYSDTKYEHPKSTDGTHTVDSSLIAGTTSINHEGTFTVATGALRDASGHISKVVTESFKLPAAYTHPVIAKANATTSVDTSVLTAVTLNSSTSFTVVNGVYRDASGHVGKVSTTTYTMPATAFTDTKCTSASIATDTSVDTVNDASVAVYKNAAISMSGSGTSLSGTATAVYVATPSAVATAKSEAIAAATVYWETL